MDSFGTFLYQSGISIAVFYLFYWALLRRETWFTLNRILLFSSLVLAVTIPFVKITLHTAPEPGTIYYALDRYIMDGVIVHPAQLAEGAGIRITAGKVLLMIYLAGVLFFLIKFLVQLLQVLRLILRYGVREYRGYRIVPIDEGISPFSFFTFIFLNPDPLEEKELESILRHEWEHVRRLHTLDILLLEIICIIQWFNPFVWLYKYSLHELHEYEADQAVINRGENRLNYQQLILSQAFGHNFFPVVHELVNRSFIKKRLIMITKKKSRNITLLKSLLILPVAAILVVSFSFTRDPGSLRQVKEFFITSSPVDNPNATSLTTTPQKKKVYEANEVDQQPRFQGKPKPYFVMWLREQVNNLPAYENKKWDLWLTLDKNGKIKKFTLTPAAGQQIDPKLTEELKQLIASAPAWTPATKDGKKVAVRIYLPVRLTPLKQLPEGEEELFFIVEEMPKFQGGDLNKFREWVASQIHYPEEVAEKGQGGRVTVSFIIEPDGRVDQVSVKESSGVPALDSEAVHVVSSSPRWTPGKQRGKKVRVQQTVPIIFLMDNSQEETPQSYLAGARAGEEVYFIVEEMPKFQGHDFNHFKKWVAEHVHYPKEAAENGIEGSVFVRFIVFPDGHVDSVTVVRGVDPLLDAEAARVVRSSPKWTPGKQKGKKVPVAFVVPVVFKLVDSPPPPVASPDGEIFFIVEQMPKFQGGDINTFREWVASQVRYPEDAEEKGISGRVLVSFIVEPDGHVDQVTVKRSSGYPSLDAEAVRVISSSPRWEPGMQRGRKVRVMQTIPIVFVNDHPVPAQEALKNMKGKRVVYILDGKKLAPGEIQKVDAASIANVRISTDPDDIKKYGSGDEDGVIFITSYKKVPDGSAPPKPAPPKK